MQVVAAVIFDENSKILACERPQGKALAGFWEFPGGKVEPGETAQQALARELQEELAMQAEIGEEIYTLDIPQPDKVIKLHFLRARKLPGSDPVPCENQRFCWLAADELNKVNWLASDQEFVNSLAEKQPDFE